MIEPETRLEPDSISSAIDHELYWPFVKASMEREGGAFYAEFARAMPHLAEEEAHRRFGDAGPFFFVRLNPYFSNTEDPPELGRKEVLRARTGS